MQEAGTIPHWIQLALTALASIVSGIGIDKLYNSWLNRRKPAAEVHVTQATAAEITLRASSSASDSVMRMMDRLDAAQLTIDRLRCERDEWRSRALDEGERADKADADAQTAQLFVDQLNAAAKLTVCRHHPTGVRLSDFSPRQLNQSLESKED